jgi:hypothetical protein
VSGTATINDPTVRNTLVTGLAEGINRFRWTISYRGCTSEDEVDITNQVKLIEINNNNNEINFYQMNRGPLFGKYTQEIINYCQKSRKSFCIDFDYE